ncbi:MAG TPA: hypothetical protein PLP50_14755 [Thermoanaerobaculia bacterium]|jgi:hypothetical protein|nr:hypothetical protein [Thermoanaerobaculia bacterium]HPA52852.1 hypothetical protein [Thermoanaerobaculia bacterium]HQN06091.1 hypothetical protein [Thermoanaerobaculia bacterium]HQP87053.1 hypothetical protein [Thermoanaerobaculia bacterium]
MERSMGLSDRPVPGRLVGRLRAEGDRPTTVEGERRVPGLLSLLLLGEAAAFAALQVSGNIPETVTVLVRALLLL